MKGVGNAMNGYFRMIVDNKGTSVELIPPTDGGETIRVAELKDYLDKIGVPYDTQIINSSLHKLEDKPCVVFLHPNKIVSVDEKCDIQVMNDKMTVDMRMFPKSDGGVDLTKETILKEISDAKVKMGIDETAIDEALKNRQYCTDIIVAKGALPTSGRDATINYYFDTNNKARPDLKEDGSVDFFKLNTLHHCTKGQVLCEIIPEERGQDGFDVFGTVMLAREVKKAKFDHGRNLQISEDGLKLISMVDGHVTYVNGAVFVSDIYSVEDVGPSTGNIEYHGNVEVKGNVCENFSIVTDGDVYVNGVVEGARIEAGGNIIIARGIHGQNKAVLSAGGNVIAKFISAAEVQAKGFIEAEQLLNAKVTAGTEVNVEAGKGLITGGKVIAKKAVNVKNAGSPMGATTIIEVGVDPEVKKRVAVLQKDIMEETKNINQFKSVLSAMSAKLQSGVKLTPQQVINLKNVQAALKTEQEQFSKNMEELQTLDELVKYEGNAHIDVRGTMHQGVAITISGINMSIKNEYTFCRLIKKGADIVSTNL